jgi:hypothetical protein
MQTKLQNTQKAFQELGEVNSRKSIALKEKDFIILSLLSQGYLFYFFRSCLFLYQNCGTFSAEDLIHP